MYYAYTGKLVPIGQSRVEAAGDIIVALLNAGITMPQAEAIKKALSVKPVNRFQSMTEFEEAYFGPKKQKGRDDQGSDEETDLFFDRITVSLQQLKDNPTFPVVAGACFAIALVLQLFL